uniref:Uncharacterized protein n=1 Tax=Oryza glaberrima TaxID=4538 RepID=I1NU75_ORYGL
MARVTAVGDGYEYDGVVVGHPVIQFGDGAPPAVVGYPLPKEPPPPQPPATLQRGRPEQRCSSRCGPCEIFTVTFMVVVAVESLTYFLLAMIGMASVIALTRVHPRGKFKLPGRSPILKLLQTKHT